MNDPLSLSRSLALSLPRPLTSLRARLALTFALVVALSLLVAAISLSALLRGYSSRLVLARLDDVAVVAFLQARALLQRGNTPAQVLDLLAEQADRLDVRILLLDHQGRVLREVGEGPSLLNLRIPVEESTLRWDDIGGPRRPGRRPIQGSFRSPRDGETYLYAAVPAIGAAARQADPPLLLVAQPEGSPLAALGPLAPRLALAAGAGLLAGLVAAVLLARWLSRPLAHLLAATRAMARGDYSQRVAPEGPPELARLAESFNTMAAEVESSRQIMHRFVSTLSHELRTPLTSIRGFAQAVLEGRASSPEEVERAMRIVDHEARRMQRLSTELLDLSRLQAGQVPMRREAIDLAELIRQCVEVLAVRAAERQVDMEVDLPPDLVVVGDADRLEQVFTNLLDNAVKFSPAGGTVEVGGSRGETTPDEGGAPSPTREGRLVPRSRLPARGRQQLVVVEISNSGPPIPAEDLPHIFEQFYTGREGQERGGTGLGLAIAREIARAHGGDLSADSQPGRTTFRALLPLGSTARDTVVTPAPLTAVGPR